MTKFYLQSCHSYYSLTESEIKNSLIYVNPLIDKLSFNIKILYLNTNYLKLFKTIYSDYKLSKGEYILLRKITDFFSKFLEQSLIIKFNPKLNITNKVVFTHFEWEDKFLNIYGNYLLSNKYSIYVLVENKRRPHNIKNVFNTDLPLIYHSKIDKLVNTSTLTVISSRYNLNPYEVLCNLGRYHLYKGAHLIAPLKIIKINP
jgi:hypothetical protein